MSSSNELNTYETLDDIENLLFLCDRLHNRLNQVTSYVDEVKKTWVNKRQSIELDPTITPLIAQKAMKFNKVLLTVAEKLAVVELQTESLHNLHTYINNEKEQLPTSIPKSESISNTIYSQQREILPTVIRPSLSTNTFTARNTSTLFSETVSVKTPVEQLQQQQSAFHRPLSVQEKSSPQNLPLTSKIMINGSMNTNLPDSMTSTKVQDSNVIDNKIRIKMQVISNGTIWRNADIPIVDHPSAFFVSNQDPRVIEQFHMMSVEMNNYYNKPTNTIVPLQNISIGDFCVARFSEDNLWYRARIVLNNVDSVLIVFIDYGNSESKPHNEVYPLIESLARLPAMTVACTLHEAFPSNENFWTQEASEAFNMIAKNRIVEVHFQQGVGQQWPLHFVKIMLDGQSIAQHPKLAPHIKAARNEQIALHFNDKLTPVEYILYNVAVVESDIYNNTLP